MIEPTDEMRQTFHEADMAFRRETVERLGLNGVTIAALNAGGFKAGLAAVFAIVERDRATQRQRRHP